MATATPAETPYRSVHTIDDVPNMKLDTLEQDNIVTVKYQSFFGSLLYFGSHTQFVQTYA
jgi:hypothetical protein